MKNTHILLLIFFYSCSHFEQTKTLYFANQLTPTINTSLTLISAYLNCLKDQNRTLDPNDKISFSVIGDEAVFTLKEIISPTSIPTTCSELVKSTYYEIPYINKMTRWFDKEKNEFTTDEKHGYLYNFRQLYKGSLYQLHLLSLNANEVIILIKRQNSNNCHTNGSSQSSFHEQFEFRAGVTNGNKIHLIYPWPKENLSLIW